MTSIFDEARNRWASILPALGVSSDFLTGRNCPCPMCGGRDRFRFTNHEGRGCYICNQCGNGDGLDLLVAFKGWTAKEAANEVRSILGITRPDRPKPVVDLKRQREERNAIWKGACRLEGNPAAVKWWMGRVGFVPTSLDLRASDALHHPYARQNFPGMVAIVRGPDGKPVQLHRTFLTPDGRKADADPSRMVMSGEMPPGSSVQLAPPGEWLGIAEGIETAVAAQALFDVPTWAALNADNLQKWTPPEGVKVMIFADNDASFTGAAAAYALAKRLVAKRFTVKVQMPSVVGEDWNDALRIHRGLTPANDHAERSEAA